MGRNLWCATYSEQTDGSGRGAGAGRTWCLGSDKEGGGTVLLSGQGGRFQAFIPRRSTQWLPETLLRKDLDYLPSSPLIERFTD